jgi:hypothetical protein
MRPVAADLGQEPALATAAEQVPDQRDREQFSVCAGRSGTGTTRDQQRARLDGVINQAVDIDEQQLSCQHGGDSCGEGNSDNCLLPQEPLAIKHHARRVATFNSHNAPKDTGRCGARVAYSFKATGVRAPSRGISRPAPEHKDAA